MFCLITSCKLCRQEFEFSLKAKVMGLNPDYLLKIFSTLTSLLKGRKFNFEKRIQALTLCTEKSAVLFSNIYYILLSYSDEEDNVNHEAEKRPKTIPKKTTKNAGPKGKKITNFNL